MYKDYGGMGGIEHQIKVRVNTNTFDKSDFFYRDEMLLLAYIILQEK